MARLIVAAAVAASLIGAAQARTITISDIVNAGGSLEVAGARILVTEPSAAETLSRAERRDAALSSCSGAPLAFCIRRAEAPAAQAATLLTIFLDEGVTIGNFSFDDAFAGESPASERTVALNGVAHRLSDLSTLTLAGPSIFIDLDAAAAQQLSLRSFDLAAIDAPLPAAGVLMLAGLGGIAFAKRRTKQN